MSLVTVDYQGKTKDLPLNKTFTQALAIFSLSGQASDYDFVFNGQKLDIQDLSKTLSTSQAQAGGTIQIFKKGSGGSSIQGQANMGSQQVQFSTPFQQQAQQPGQQPQFQSGYQQQQQQPPQTQFQSGYQQGQQFQYNQQTQPQAQQNPLFQPKYGGQSVNSTSDLLPPSMGNLNLNDNKPAGFGQSPFPQPGFGQSPFQPPVVNNQTAQQQTNTSQRFQPQTVIKQSQPSQQTSAPNFAAAPKPIVIKKPVVTDADRILAKQGDEQVSKEINGWVITIADYGAKVILEADNGDFKAQFLEADASNEGTAKLQLNAGMFINDADQIVKIKSGTKVLLQSSRKGIAIYWYSKLVTLFDFYLDD